ncbi:MAG: carbon storage regulator [Fuerstiella sp.]
MLVLTRKCDEEIIIDGRISVRVVDCRGGRVRLGITAPDDVHIVRSEICFDADAVSCNSDHLAAAH